MNKRTALVNINDREVVVKKLPLGKYADVFSALQELPKQLSGLENFSNDEFIEQIPQLIQTCLPELAKIISVATNVPEKEITEELGLDEVTDLIVAAIEVNNIEKVVDNVKKLMARKAPANSIGSTVPSTSLPVNTTGPSPKS